MKKHPFLHFLSLLMLLGMIVTPLVPSSVLSAAPPPVAQNQSPPAKAASQPVSKEALLAYQDHCRSETPGFLLCLSDGTLPGSPKMQAIRGGTGPTIDEGPSSAGNPNLLDLLPGDILRVPFSITYINQAACNNSATATIPATNGLSLGMNPTVGPQTSTISGPTYLNLSGNVMTFGDGVVNFDTTSSAVDTVFGYFDVTINGTDAKLDTAANKQLFNFQLRSANIQECTSQRVKLDVTGPDAYTGIFISIPWRRPRLVGFGAAFTTPFPITPTPVELSTTKVTFKISNVVANSTFTYNAVVTPSGTGITPVLTLTNTSNACPTSTTAGADVTCDIAVGPLPTTMNALTLTLTIVGTVGSQSAVTQTLTATIPIAHPAISITKVDMGGNTVYPPGSTIQYKVTLTNTGGVPLSQFRVLDSLGGDITSLFLPPASPTPCFPLSSSTLAPGATCEALYSYTLTPTDGNPLLNTANVDAIFTPQTGPAKQISATTTYSVKIEAPNLDLQFQNGPNPDYALVGGTLAGTVLLQNTGTVTINMNNAMYKLVNAANPTEIFATGNLTNVPASIAAGVTVSPSPAYSLNVPLLAPTVFAVDLIISVQGQSTAGVSVPRTITKRLDVVRSDLRIQVTSDATSNTVTRGQIVKYTVKLQNISATAPLTNITLTQETLNAYPGGITNAIVPDLAAGASFSLPEFSYTVQATDADPLTEKITANFGPTGNVKTATGQLSLTISDLNIAVTLFGQCQFLPPETDLLKPCSNGGQPIVNNSLQPPTIFRYFVGVSNAGSTRVTNVRACMGIVATCKSTDANYVSLSANILEFNGSSATGEKGVNYPVNSISTSIYTEYVTVIVTDQKGADVSFRGSATFSVVSPNLYVTTSKTTAANQLEYFVGETITYQVRLCYDGPNSDSNPLIGLTANDPLKGAGNNGFITLTVVDSTGTPTGLVGTSVTLIKSECAIGSFTYIAQSVDLLTKDKVDLKNTVTFHADQLAAFGIANGNVEQSLVLTLKNPLKITKIATLNGVDDIGPTTKVPVGKPVTYVYTLENLGPLPITGITTLDRFPIGEDQKVLYRTSCDVNPDSILDGNDPTFQTTLAAAGTSGDKQTIKCTTFAYGATGKNNTVNGSWTNVLKASGIVNTIAVQAEKGATLQTRGELEISKLVSNETPFYYDPPITYTVTITNKSAAADNIVYKLMDATDSLSGSLIKMGDPPSATGYTITADTEGYYLSAPTVPVKIKDAVLIADQSFVVEYQILPSVASDIRNGSLKTPNLFTLKARVSSSANTAIPDLEEYVVENSATVTVTVYTPLDAYVCTVGGINNYEKYVGWGEQPSFDITFGVSGAVTTSVTITKIQLILAGTTYDITLTGGNSFSPGQSRNTVFKLPQPVPWNSATTSYDGSQLYVEFTLIPPAPAQPTNWFGYTNICKGIKVGPPVVLKKVANPTVGNIGSVINYTITAENPTYHTTITTFTLTDAKVRGGLNIPLKDIGGTVVTQLLPQSAYSADPFDYTITATDSIPFINIAELTGTYTVDGGPSNTFPNPLQAKATVTIPSPELTIKLITKDTSNVDKTTFNVNETIVYLAEVKNNSNRQLKLLTARTLEPSPLPLTGFDPAKGLTDWSTERGSAVLDPGETVLIQPTSPIGTYRINAPDGFNMTPPQYTFTSTLSIDYEPVVDNPTTQTSTGKTTIDLNNPNLQVTLRNQTNGVASYGTVIVYDVRVQNPSTSGVTITNLTVSENPVFGTASDLWYFNTTPDTGGVGEVTPTRDLAPGDFYTRRVRHEVLTSDFSPLTYTVTAEGNYTIGSNTFVAKDVRTSTVIISDDQLLATVTLQKPAMGPSTGNEVDITYTNIGSLAVNEMSVSVIAEDINGVALSNSPGFSFDATCVLLPPVGDLTTQARCEQNPPVSSPGYQLSFNANTFTKFTFKTPSDVTQFNALPSPLVLKFTASGVTQDGQPFEPVITRVPVRLIKNTVLIITEQPDVSAATVGGTVQYLVQVQNLSTTTPLVITEVKDNVTQQVLTFNFPTGTGTTGTLDPNQKVTATQPVVIQSTFGDPFLHSTTATGTQNSQTLTDTSFSQVKILNTAITATYTGPSVGSPNTSVPFDLVVQNVSTKSVTLTATDTDNNTAITLYKDALRTQALGTDPVAPGAFAYGRNTVTLPGAIGQFISRIKVDATDTDNAKFSITRQASLNIVGVGMIFTVGPTATPAAAKAGDTVTVNFTVRNGGTVAAEGIDALTATCAAVGCTLTAGFPTTLAPGAEASGSFTYTVRPIDTGTVTLGITVAGEQINTAIPVSVSGVARFTVAVGNMVLTKTSNATNGVANPGATIQYTVRMENIGSTPLTITSINDTLQGAITPANPTVAANAFQNVQYNYTIPAAASGTLVNTVIVQFTDGTTSFTATAQATVTILPVNSTLAVRVSASPAMGRPGDAIVFSTEVTNTGTQDVLLVPYNAASPSTTTFSSLGIDMGVSGLLNPNQTRTFTSATYTIPATASGTISNVVTVVGNTTAAPITTVRGIGTGTVNVIATNGLSVTKTANRQTARAGDVITYTVLITNTNNSDINIQGITDTLVNPIPGLPTFPFGLTAFSSYSLTYTYTVGASVPQGLLPNTVTISADTPGNPMTYASASANVIITTGSSGLLITGSTGQTSYTPGDAVVYNVTVINTGAATQSGIAATYLPVGTTGAGTSITLGSNTLATNQQTTGVFVYTTSTGSPNPLQMGLNVTGNPGPAANGVTNIIPRNSGLTLTGLLTAAPAQVVAANDQVNYTLTVWNTSANPVTGITAAVNTTATPNTTNLDSAGYDLSTVISQLAGTTLAAGASRTVSFRYTVQSGDLSKGNLYLNLDLTPVGTTTTTTVAASAVTVAQPVLVSVTSFGCTAVVGPGSATPYCYLRPNSAVPITVTVQNQGTNTLTNLVISFNTSPVFTVPLTTAEQTLAAGATLTKTFTWTIPTLGISPSGTNEQTLALLVTATATGMTQVTAPQSPNLKFIDPRININSVALNSGYTAPLTDLSTFQFLVKVANSSNTQTNLALVGRDSANNNRLRVSLLAADGTSTDITSAVTVVSASTAPNPARTGVIADLDYGATVTDLVLGYTIQANTPNPFRIMVSAAGCVKTVVECEANGTATNGLNTPVTTTGSSTSINIARAMLSVTESSSNPTTTQVGQALALAFTISNPGSVGLVNLAAGNVTLNGTAISEKLSLGSATSITAGGSVSATLTHTVLSTDPTTLNFVISLSGNSGTTSGPTVSTTYTTRTVTVGNGNVAANGLAIAMTVDKATPTNGSTVVYTITLTNTSVVPIQTVALTDVLPTTLVGKTATTDTGTATLSGSTVAAAIGTLNASQKAVVTVTATINATAPATITNQACAISATNTTPICASASVSLAPGGANGTPGTLPTTGFGGNDMGGMFIMLVVSALLFLAMTARTRGAGPFLIIVGVIVGIIAVALIFTIIRNTGQRVAVNATNTAIVAPTVIAQRTNAPRPTRGTDTPLPAIQGGATFTPIPTATPIPSATPISSATPVPKLFDPVGEKSLYIPKLALPRAVPIIELPLKNETWDVTNLGQSIGHLEQTSWLGKTGNTVLVAHIQLNFREMGPFRQLDQLKKGDQVMVYDRGGFYVYEVTDSKVVAPTNVEVTFPTPQAQLTLITCTVWDANRGVFAKRLVVTAKLLKAPDSV